LWYAQEFVSTDAKLMEVTASPNSVKIDVNNPRKVWFIVKKEMPLAGSSSDSLFDIASDNGNNVMIMRTLLPIHEHIGFTLAIIMHEGHIAVRNNKPTSFLVFGVCLTSSFMCTPHHTDGAAIHGYRCIVGYRCCAGCILRYLESPREGSGAKVSFRPFGSR
jgi:hypothetical protein